MINRALILIMLVVMSQATLLHSQRMIIDPVKICVDQDTVLVPVNVADFNNVGAITLYIVFDTAILQFDTIIDVNPSLPGVLANKIPNKPQVGIVWSATNSGVDVTDKFCDLRFVVKKAGFSNLSFDPSCEVVDFDANVMNVNYKKGSVEVTPLPVVSFTGLADQYCLTSSADALTGIPAGGTFSGDGVVGDSFNAALAGLGLHSVTYVYTDENGCSAAHTQTVTVNDSLTVSFSGLNQQYCINATSAQLTGNPAGGTFSGNGISGNMFSAAIAGLGTHQITYSYTDQSGCSGSYTQAVTVNNLPAVSFNGLDPHYCLDADAVQLTGIPAGGQFSGAGISGSIFNPSVAGAGTHTVTYTYADSLGCSNSATATTTVDALPVVSIGGLHNYCVNDPADTLTGTPAGGQFNGAGISGNVFNPFVAGVGTHTITYTYTANTGCSNSATAIATVNQNLVVTITPSDPAICSGSSVTLTAGGAAAYLWSNGETTASIVVSPGSTTAYTVIGSNGTDCQDTAAATVTVNPLPVVTANASANTVPGPDTTWVIRNVGTTFNPNSITISYGDSVRFQLGGSHNAVEVSQATWNANGSTPLPGGFSTPFGGGVVTPANLAVGAHYYVCAPHAGMGMKGVIIVTSSYAVCAGTSVTLTGSGASTYSWSHGVTDGVGFVPTSTETYTVTGTDANGCTNSQSVKVTVVPSPVVTITPSNQTICSGSSAILTASGATTYLWSTGETTASIVISPASTSNYTVTGSNASGCTATQSAEVAVNQNPAIVITPLNPAICNGGSATLTASGATTYLWSTGETTASIIVSPVSTTTYAVTGTDANGCSDTQSVEVTVGEDLVVTITPANPAVCIGSSVTLTAGGATTFLWSTGESTGSIVVSPVSATTYTVIGSAGSCQDTATTTVTVNPLPVVTANLSANTVPGPDTTWVIRNVGTTFNPNNITISYGDSVRFQLGGSHNAVEVSQATWNSNGNTPLPGGFSTPFGGGIVTPANLTVGTHYYVCAPHAGMGMKGVIIVTASPAAVCAGTSVTLSGSGANTYSWSHGVVDGVGFVPTSTATYTVTGTDANGCTNTQSVQVIVIPGPSISIVPSSFFICSGESAILTASGASTYLWNTGETTASIVVSPDSTTTYTVTGSNASGCTSVQSVQIGVSPNAVVTIISSNPSICSGSSATLTASGATTYLWSTGETTASIVVSPASTTTYAVTGTLGSCTGTQSAVVIVNPNPAISIIPSDPSVCKGDSVTLTAQGASAYSWSNGETTASIVVSPDSTMTYIVMGTDANGCSNTQAVQVIVNQNVVVAITPSDVSICNGSSATLTASGASAYLWSTGETTASIVVSPASTTTYTVTGTLGSCTGTQTAVITVNPNPTISIVPSNSSICSGGSVTLTASGASTYLWSNGETAESIVVSPDSTTMYTVTGILGSCTGTQTAVIAVNPNPTISIVPSNPSICSGGSVTLTASGASAYLWSTGEITASIIVSPVSTTTYTVTGTDANGCSGAQSVEVIVNQNVVVTITPSNPEICKGSSVTLTAGGASDYLWSSGETTASIVVTPDSTTTYAVTGTLGTCTGTQTAVVTVNPNPIVIIAPSNPSICSGGSVTLMASGASTYLWSTGEVTASIIVSPVSTTTYTVTGTDANGCSGTQSVEVIVNQNVVVTITPSNPEICKGNAVTLTAGGAATYLWSNGETTASIVVTPDSTTTYAVTGMLGTCTGTQTVAVTVNPDPTVSITPSTSSICKGSSVTLTVSGASTYLWSNGETTASIIVSPDSTVAYTVTGTLGSCTATQTAVITVNPNPTISIVPSNPSICNGGSVTLTASGASAYLWSTGEITASIIVSPVSTTTYTVTGTDVNGCSNTQSVEVIVNQNVVVTITPSNSAICKGNSAMLTASGASGYLWSNGETTASIIVTPDSTTSYTVIGTLGSCTGTQTAVVTVNPNPTVSIVPSNPSICSGGSVTLTASGASTYLWSNGETTESIVVSPDSTTAYSVTGTLGRCTGIQTAVVTVNPNPTVSIVPSNPSICSGGSVTLTASGTSTYLWSTGEITASIIVSPVSTTTYTVTGTDANGCSGAQSVEVIVNQSVLVAVTPSNPEICKGSSVTLTASGASAYLWSNGETTASIVVTPDSTMAYTVMGTVGSCTGTQTTVVTVNPNPTVSITPSNPSICNGGSVTLTASGASTYLWSTGEITASIIVSPVSTTTYTVTGTDSNGCSGTQSVEIIVNQNVVVTIAPSSPEICKGSLATLTASGASAYVWSNGDTTASIVVAPDSTTAYSVTGTAGSCMGSQTAVVTVNPAPTVIIIPSNPSICSGGSVTLTASGASSYLWSNGETTASITVSPDSTTTYIVTGILGTCAGIQTAVVTVNPNPTVSIAPSNSSICSGGSVTLTASGAAAYLWSNGETTASIVVSPASITTYSVTGILGTCTGTQTAVVMVSPTPTVSIVPSNPSICSGGSVTLTASGAATYLWSNGETTASIIVSPASTTTYAVTGILGACTGAQTAVVIVNPNPIVSIVPSNPSICIGGSVTLTASGASAYLWSNGETTASIVVSPASTTTYSVTGILGTCTGAQTAVVTVSPTPAVSIVPSNPSICSGSSVTLTANGASGYSWSTGATTQSIIVSPGVTTSYSVTGTNGNGCTAVQTALVTANPTPTVTIMPSNPSICAGSSVTLTASGASAYLWNNGQTSSSIVVSPAVTTTYSVTGKLGNCSAAQQTTVTVTPKPIVSITPSSSTICNGSAVTLTANGASGYSWNTGATTQSIIVSPGVTTSYSVTGTNGNGCTAVQTASVTVNPTPTVTIMPSNPSICAGSSVTLTASGASAYLWNTGQTTVSIIVSPASTATYSVTGKLGNCTATQKTIVTVNPKPVISINPSASTICNGSSVTLTANGASAYTWNTGATTQSIIVSPSATTTYSVTGTNGGCSAVKSVQVIVNPLPVIAIAPANPVICKGSSVTLTASGASAYVWSTGQTTSVIVVTPTATTSYTVTGKNSNGCTASKSVQVTVNPIPVVTITPANPAICKGSSVTLTASGATTYLWNNGQTTASIIVSPNATTTYSVTGKNGSCTTAKSVQVTVSPIPNVVIVPGNPKICEGGSATLTAAGNASIYLWSTGQTTSSIVVSPGVTTVYTVIGSNAGGCQDIATKTVTVTPSTVTVNAGANKNVYVGYTPLSCTTLAATGIGGGTPAYSQSWSTGATTNSIVVCPVINTKYTVTVTDAKGCKAKDSVQVCAKDVRCQTDNVMVCGTFTVMGHVIGRQTYCVPEATATALLSLNNPFTSWTLGACGSSTACDFSSSGKTELEGGDFGRENLTAREHALIYGSVSVKLYPNPISNSSLVNIEMINIPDKTVQVTVTDVIGQVLFSERVAVNEYYSTKQLNFNSDLPRGTYMVSVITGTTVITERLIIQ